MKTASVLVTLSLCAGCMVDREIGGGLDPRRLVTSPPRAGVDPAPQGLPAPPPPPPPSSPGACCRVGPQMVLDRPGAQGSRPAVAWNGTGWAVSWYAIFGLVSATTRPTDHRLPVIRMVEGDVPGAIVELDERVMFPSAIAHHPEVAPGEGYVLALASAAWPEADSQGRVVAVDAAGVRRASVTIEAMSGGAALVRATGLDAWAVLTHEDEGGPPGRAQLVLLDDGLTPLGSPVALGRALQEDSLSVNVLSLEDKVITVLPASDGVHIRTFVGRGLAEPDPGLILDVGSMTNADVPRRRDGTPIEPRVRPVASIAATRVGDAVVIAAMNRETIRTWSYRPSTRTITDGPTVVGTSTHHGRLSAGGDSQGGTAGLCFSVGDGPGDPDGLQFALVGPDGRPRGEPVTIASGLRYVASCDVAAGRPDEYLVAIWNAAGISPPPSMLAARVQVQRPKPVIE